ncbi:MAG: cytochrome c oxidase subunit 3 [Leeuwenhoekiella sp.]
MDYTSQPEDEKIIRSKKMMLWFGIISLSMMFAGLTSAYIVSKSRKDWITNFELPQAFYISTAVIILSSVTMHFAKRSIQQGKDQAGKILLAVTFALGLTFVFLQFLGFDEIIEQGYFFTGSESTITTSFIYAFVISHIVHIGAGLLVLIFVVINQFRGKYKNGKTLGVELGATFWHFVDVLWVYLFLFLLFFR